MSYFESKPDQSQFANWQMSEESGNKKNKYKLGQVIGKGGNSVVYEVQGNPNLVILDIGGNWGGSRSTEGLQKSLDDSKQEIELYKKIPEGVQAPKILDVWIENGKLYKLMEKAVGKPMHNREGSFENWQNELEVIADVPIEHYQKLVSDIKELHNVGLQADPGKPDNFYYDQKTGFQLIDLDPGDYDASSDIEVPLIHTYYLFNKYQNQINGQIKNSIKIILSKLQQCGFQIRESRLEDINEVIQ